MTQGENLFIWTADITVAEGNSWKFRTNGDWGDNPNLGGTPEALWMNGANISLPEAATYTITLDLSTYPSTFTAVKK